MYKLYFPNDTLKERDDIIIWYAEQSEQATDNFIKEFDETVNKICLNPFRYRNVYKNYREVKMKTFPYHIVYGVNEKEKEVSILRIYHTSRNPKIKYRNF